MGFFPGLSGLIDSLSDAVSGVIDMDPDELAILKKTLHDNATDLEGSGFQDISLGESAFGGSPAAAELGKHHQLAHTIVADTILGVIEDLHRYRQGVIDFEKGMEVADTTASGDLSAIQGAVDSLASTASHSEGDRRNLESRSLHLPGDAGDGRTS